MKRKIERKIDRTFFSIEETKKLNMDKKMAVILEKYKVLRSLKKPNTKEKKEKLKFKDKLNNFLRKNK